MSLPFLSGGLAMSYFKCLWHDPKTIVRIGRFVARATILTAKTGNLGHRTEIKSSRIGSHSAVNSRLIG